MIRLRLVDWSEVMLWIVQYRRPFDATGAVVPIVAFYALMTDATDLL